MQKSGTKMSWDIEYTIEIDFKNQGIKYGKLTPYYNGMPKDQVDIDEDGTVIINLIKDKKEQQQLKIVLTEGQAIIDLTKEQSNPDFSGGGKLEVEVREMEIPKQVLIGGDGEEKSFVVDENGKVRDQTCCILI